MTHFYWFDPWKNKIKVTFTYLINIWLHQKTINELLKNFLSIMTNLFKNICVWFKIYAKSQSQRTVRNKSETKPTNENKLRDKINSMSVAFFFSLHWIHYYSIQKIDSCNSLNLLLYIKSDRVEQENRTIFDFNNFYHARFEF